MRTVHLSEVGSLVMLVMVSVAVLSPAPALAEDEEYKSAFVKLSPPWLSTATTVFDSNAKPGQAPVRPRINFTLTNRSKRAFWVETVIRAPASDPSGLSKANLQPKQTIEVESTQDTILAATDYALGVVVCSDEAMTDTLDQFTTQLSFPAQATEEINARLAMRRRDWAAREEAGRSSKALLDEGGQLPKTYTSIVLVEGKVPSDAKLNEQQGTLTVRTDSLVYVSAHRTVALAGTQVLDVYLHLEGVRLCVGVKYDAAGTEKRMLFLTGPGARDLKLDLVRGSLLALQRAAKKPD